MPKKAKIELGTIALIGIFILSALFVYYPFGIAGTLLIALLGALMAVKHIQIEEENDFLIAITAFVVVTTALRTATIGELNSFLTHLIIGFGAGGFFVALGKLVKLGWR